MNMRSMLVKKYGQDPIGGKDAAHMNTEETREEEQEAEAADPAADVNTDDEEDDSAFYLDVF